MKGIMKGLDMKGFDCIYLYLFFGRNNGFWRRILCGCMFLFFISIVCYNFIEIYINKIGKIIFFNIYVIIVVLIYKVFFVY